MQAQQLPTAAVSTTRERLAARAGQAQLIRSGSLRLSKELGCCHRSITMARLSARADMLAAPVGERARVKLLSVAEARLDLHAQLASPEAHTLRLPRGAGCVLHLCFSPCGERLVVISGRLQRHALHEQLTEVRVTAFRGSELVGTFSEPLTARESDSALHTAAGCFFLVIRVLEASINSHHTRVLVGALDGSRTAGHPVVPAADWTCSAQDACLAAVSVFGDTLFICSAAAGMRAVSLNMSPRIFMQSRVSLCGALAAVRSRGQCTDQVLWVDLRRMCVLHRLQRDPNLTGVVTAGHIAAGASSVAIWVQEGIGHVTVLSSAGPDRGRPLFSHAGTRNRDADAALACFDSVLGVFLAVVSPDLSVAVRHGVSGQLVATLSCQAPEAGLQVGWLSELSWLPGRAVLVCKTIADRFSADSALTLWSVLEFAARV